MKDILPRLILRLFYRLDRGLIISKDKNVLYIRLLKINISQDYIQGYIDLFQFSRVDHTYFIRAHIYFSRGLSTRDLRDGAYLAANLTSIYIYYQPSIIYTYIIQEDPVILLNRVLLTTYNIDYRGLYLRRDQKGDLGLERGELFKTKLFLYYNFELIERAPSVSRRRNFSSNPYLIPNLLYLLPQRRPVNL